MDTQMELISEHACFGGVQAYYRHLSSETGLPMRFSIYRPPQQAAGPVPVLVYLAGLTCTEETFMIKAGAQRYAAQHGIMLVAPDTSPRNTGIDGIAADWDFGEGAGFYLDAGMPSYAQHFRMESYIVGELLPMIAREFATVPGKTGVFGHSMGGHGALVLALRHPELFCSVSAFAPIAAPTQCPWGEKAFSRYLGDDRALWLEHDASALMRQRQRPFPAGILIDQGLSDQFLETQLKPALFEAACAQAGQPLTLRMHPGYDHSYYFVSSFMADHLAFHQQALNV